MPNLSLEGIPPEVLVEIMQCLPDYNDLHAILISSAICYGVFKVYKTSILTQIALNILGPENWSDATAVLVYQRDDSSSISEFAAVKKDLESKFVLTNRDITQLLINQDFFESCATDFTSFLSEPTICPNCGDNHHEITQGTTKHSFVAGDTLSMGIFYRMWLLSLQFGYDSIIAFSNRAIHSKQDAANLQFVSQIMYRNESYFDVVRTPTWSCRMFDGIFSCNIFSLLEITRSSIMNSDVLNPLLMMKMMSHFVAATIGPRDGPVPGGFRTKLRLFLLDYSKMSMEALMEKYKLGD